jgi:hypothetical protein
MKRWNTLGWVVATAVLASAAFAQEKKDDKPAAKPDAKATKPDAKPGAAQDKAGQIPGMPEMTPEQQAAMEKAMTPGPNHKLLEYMVGEWTTKCKMRMDEKAPWMDSDGTCSAKWILDGRFVQSEHKGTMMGQPHVGIATTGYDNMKEKFVGTWMDNCCTALTFSEGSYDPSTKTFTWNTQMECPIEKGPVKIRYTTRVIDKDNHVFEWYETRGGKESKTMEITYKRKSAA